MNVLCFLCGLVAGALYGSRGKHQRGAAAPPPPDSPRLGQVEIGVDLAGSRDQDYLMAAASEIRETLNSTDIAARAMSSAHAWIEEPVGYLLDEDLKPIPCFDEELIERAWADESRRVRISYLDGSYELVRYPEDASYVLSTVFLPEPLRTEGSAAKFFSTGLLRKEAQTPFLWWFTAWYHSTFLPPALEGFVWHPVLDASRPVYSSYDDAVEGHLRVLEELAEKGWA